MTSPVSTHDEAKPGVFETGSSGTRRNSRKYGMTKMNPRRYGLNLWLYKMRPRRNDTKTFTAKLQARRNEFFLV